MYVKRESEREVSDIEVHRTEGAKDKCWKGMAAVIRGGRTTKRGTTKAEEKRETA